MTLLVNPALAEEEKEVLSVVGSRSLDRSAADLAVPVDVIDADNLRSQGATRMDSMLSTLVPSYNVGQQPISDAATLVRPANMRGLPPDSTLVLVNGKRRHRSSVIAFLGAGIADGSHGADISAIPAIALDRVDVLRDGAAAQYGSDAIAGILNFVLKDDNEGGSLEARWGQYYQGDGENFTVAANVGLPLTDRGFLNLSAEYNEADPTSRSVQRADAQGLIDGGNSDVRTPAAQIWGAPEIEDDYKLFANAGIDIGDNSELYSFASYAERTVEGGFFFRNPHTRSGVFQHPDDETKLLVIDLDASDGIRCGDITRDQASNLEELNATIAALQANRQWNDNCWTFMQRFPGGFTPQFGADIEDTSFALGFRGETDGGLTYDLSAVWGEHESRFYMENTINPQLVAQKFDIPTSYNPGTYIETDYTINLDFTKQFDIASFHSPLNVGFGLEYREEEFEIKAGDENSTFIALDENGESLHPSLGVGSNGFPGFRPGDAGKYDRASAAAYVDFEADVTEDLLLNLAVRHEDPEEFSSTTDGKLAARFQATDQVALRGSFSTGFRVPTVGQANVRNTTTEITNGVLSDALTLPPAHSTLATLGLGGALEAEESENFGLGAVIEVGGLSVTIDYYHIEVDDRIGQSSNHHLSCVLLNRLDFTIQTSRGVTVNETNCASNKEYGTYVVIEDGMEKDISLTADEIRAKTVNNSNKLLTVAIDEEKDKLQSSIEDIESITTMKFFTNGFDTTTEGVDIVATYPMDMFGGLTNWTLAANWNRTEVTSRDKSVIDNKKVHQIEEALPKTRLTLTADHANGPWQVLFRARYYGPHIEYHANSENRLFRSDARWLHDLEVSYNFSDQLAVTVGAENILDEEPTNNPFATDYGSEFAENPPFNYNGGFYYLKARWNF